MSLLFKPSILSHILQSIILLYIFILLLLNEQNTNKLTILLLLSITIGIHGLSHLGLELFYGVNSIQKLFQS